MATQTQIEEQPALRFTTAGSVDDGKSTLIGRLLYDSKSVFDDQYAAIEEASERRGEDYVNLALLTDGLRAEREQGITIDVAYRYFATPRRKFIIADTPGHVQYTRNMVTGASTADLALILVDARAGVVEQTRRHAFIASLLGLPHIVVCVNKMDLAGYEQAVFQKIKSDFASVAARLGEAQMHFVPIAALHGDNVVERSSNMAWYGGPTLLQLLETVEVHPKEANGPGRFPVQYVVRPQSVEFPDFRGYAGRVAGGAFRPGDAVTVLPSGFSTTLESVEMLDGQLPEAVHGRSVTLTLRDEIDISRGDMLVKAKDAPPSVEQEIEAMVCWLHERPLQTRGRYILRHTSREVRAAVAEVVSKVNLDTLEPQTEDLHIGANDIARVRVKTAAPLVTDSYRENRATGSFILIDEGTNDTVGAGMIL